MFSVPGPPSADEQVAKLNDLRRLAEANFSPHAGYGAAEALSRCGSMPAQTSLELVQPGFHLLENLGNCIDDVGPDARGLRPRERLGELILIELREGRRRVARAERRGDRRSLLILTPRPG